MLDHRLMIDGQLDTMACAERLASGFPAGRCDVRVPNPDGSHQRVSCDGPMTIVEIDRQGLVPMAVFVCDLCRHESAKAIRTPVLIDA